MIKRILALLMALIVMAAFYVFAVMMEDEESKRTDQFLVEETETPLTPVTETKSSDARQLAGAFGAPLPIPEGFSQGQVTNSSYHIMYARLILLEGSKARLTGIRPASAAPKIMPADLRFLASGKTLLGYELLEAEKDGWTVYALLTSQSAFLIEPVSLSDPGSFTLQEP